MSQTWREITLALGGVLLATQQVDQLAKTGYLDTDQLALSLRAIINRSPNNCDELFVEKTQSDGLIEQPAVNLSEQTTTNDELIFSHKPFFLADVFSKLEQLLSEHRNPKDIDLLKYTLGILHIQKKLAANPKMLNTLSVRFDKIDNQIKHFGVTHENVISSIAELYTDTISTLGHRIQVNGEYGYLQQARVASQIRALLLSAVRFSMLWQQMGGKQWHFLFYKKHIIKAAHELVLEIKNNAQTT